MSFDWGYKEGAKMSKECGLAKGGKVAVKAHQRAPRMPPQPPAPMPDPSMMGPPPGMPPQGMPPQGMPGMKRGGKVKHYARGGKVTADKEPAKPTPASKDIPEDHKMKKGGKVDCYAKGGKVTDGKPRHMAKGGKAEDPHWMEKAFSKNKGALHRQLGVAEGKKIPAKKLEKAENSKNPLERKRANLAERGKEAAKK